jgi:hypothetical protein
MCYVLSLWFQTTVSLDGLRGSSFEQEYSQLFAKTGDLDNHDDDGYDALCRLTVEPCLAYFRDCRAPHAQKDLTFEGFYSPPTYHLKLAVSEPSFYPEATRDCYTMDPVVLMTASRDLPQYPRVSHL